MKMLKKKTETETNYKKYTKNNFAVVGGAIYKWFFFLYYLSVVKF